MEMSENQLEIYSRQIMMKEIGERGQKSISEASVLVVGCGGLGAPVLYYLAAMGIGHIGLCDGDTVSLPNLNRQILFTMQDLDKPKASTAEKRLKALNPNLKTTAYDKFIDKKTADEIIPAYDIIIDCLDNFETRFILNDTCIASKKPLIHAGVGEYYGQLMTITPGKGPCLRCLFPKGTQGDGSPVSSDPGKQTGVIGPTPGVLGAMQAMEAAKYLLGQKVCNDGLVTYNGINLTMEKVEIKQATDCICQKHRSGL